MTMLDAFHKAFEPSQVEESRRAYWEKNKFYRGVRDPSKKAYTIVIPPPNVTGDLHMGHVLNNTLQDLLIRFNRANGKAVCWIPGTDHASIATEAKVTKLLAEQGIDKKKLGREEFLKHAWSWKEKYGGRIVEVLKTLGVSCDWDREIFTMDPEYSRSVLQAIVTLYKKGLVYRGHRLVNWCPVSQSVISDEEVNPEERQGSLWHIKYPVVGQEGVFLTVATTRPETLFGDLAVAVHPQDDRYAHLVGKKVKIPVANREIPVIADTYVEQGFGSGVVKITPAHDMNDFEVGARHNLGLLNVMNPDASLNENVTEAYRGLDRFVARKKLVAEIGTLGLLEKIEPHKLVLGISERGGVPIEYYLSEQWYIKMDNFAQIALNSTRNKNLTLHPPHMEKIWEHWLTNIKDWCISRQLWWGHQLPMYTCNSCNHITASVERPPGCEKCGHTELVQDPDVLDTWASSWLWPFGVHSWANPSEENKKDLEYFYPTDIIVTGPDIIFFWIARMVMAGDFFTQKTPFREVYFTPIIRDAKGRKMSKSLGNSPDVHELIKKFGTDALRFAVVNQLVLGQDISWADDSCEIGRNFANKIWNATRFLLMSSEKLGVNPAEATFESLGAPFDASGEAGNALFIANDAVGSWVVSEFFDVVAKAHTAIERLEFSNYTSNLYEFVWMVFCDWFVELSKPRFAEGADPVVAKQTLTLAFQLLDGVLRLLHPVMPFVTEEIWQNLGGTQSDEKSAQGGLAREGKTLGFESMPLPNPHRVDESAIKAMREVQSMVSAVRAVRGQFTIHPGNELNVVVRDTGAQFGKMTAQMEFLAKAKFAFGAPKPVFAATTVVAGVEVYVNLEGLVDPAVERTRLFKKIEKLEQAIAGTRKRLSNEEFVKGAPEHILAGARAQLAANESELSVLAESLKGLGS